MTNHSERTKAPELSAHDPLILRLATHADTDRVGEIHAQAWHETYPGLMPDAAIARQTPHRSATRWRIWLDDGPRSVLFVGGTDEGLQGFASAGPRRPDGPPEATGELNALYVLQQAHGSGLGRALLHACGQALLERGFSGMGLWVLLGNDRAIHFYEKEGGRRGEEREFTLEGCTLLERAYYWDDLPSWLERWHLSKPAAHGRDQP